MDLIRYNWIDMDGWQSRLFRSVEEEGRLDATVASGDLNAEAAQRARKIMGYA